MDITVRVVDPHSEPISGAQIVALSGNGTTLNGTTDQEGCFTFTEPFPDKSRNILVAHPRRPGRLALRSPGDPASTIDVQLGDEGPTGSMIDGGWVEIPVLGSINPIRDTEGRTYVYGKNISFNGAAAQPFPFGINDTFEAVNAQGNRVQLCVKAALGDTFLIDHSSV